MRANSVRDVVLHSSWKALFHNVGESSFLRAEYAVVFNVKQLWLKVQLWNKIVWYRFARMFYVWLDGIFLFFVGSSIENIKKTTVFESHETDLFSFLLLHMVMVSKKVMKPVVNFYDMEFGLWEGKQKGKKEDLVVEVHNSQVVPFLWGVLCHWLSFNLFKVAWNCLYWFLLVFK